MSEIEANRNDSLNNHDKFAEFVHKYLQDNIARADTKLTVFCTALVFIILFLFDNVKADKILKLIYPLVSFNSWSLAGTFALIMMFSFVIALLLALYTVFPRKLYGKSAKNMIFWESILGYNQAHCYITELRNSNLEKLVENKLIHCYELAEICSEKYKYLRLSLYFAFCGIFLFAVLSLIIIPT